MSRAVSRPRSGCRTLSRKAVAYAAGAALAAPLFFAGAAHATTAETLPYTVTPLKFTIRAGGRRRSSTRASNRPGSAASAVCTSHRRLATPSGCSTPAAIQPTNHRDARLRAQRIAGRLPQQRQGAHPARPNWLVPNTHSESSLAGLIGLPDSAPYDIKGTCLGRTSAPLTSAVDVVGAPKATLEVVSPCARDGPTAP